MERKMTMIKKFLIVLLVVMMTVMLGATTTAQDDMETYVLGVALPFTGSFGTFGQDFERGIDLAVAQMNAELEAAGSSIHFETASADTEQTPEGAARALQTIVQTTGAQVVVGPLTTDEVLGAKQFADENGVVIVAMASSGPAASIPGDNIFRVIYPPDTFSSKAFATIALARGHQNMVVLHVDDPFGNGMNEQFTSNFVAGGGGEVASFAYTPQSTELSSEVAAVSAALAGFGDNAGFFCVCFPGAAQAFVQIAQIDPVLTSVQWMGNEAMTTLEMLKDPGHAQTLINADFVTVSQSAASTPLTPIFLNDFVAMFDKDPGIFTNYAFDAANIAMLTMLAAGNDGAAVKSMLPFISNHYIGTTVQAFLDENGDQAIASYGIRQVQEDGTAFEVIGTYNGNTDTITYN
jgi:ABC-type branched-subunit amino acid transport system substrate-binding protein